MQEEKASILPLKSIKWRSKSSLEKSFHIPWFGKLPVDIQTISDEALEKIINEINFYKWNIPSKREIITIEQQTDYYKKVKNQVIERLQNNHFAIIQWPTGTWKTTLVKTIWYEAQLSVYEVWSDADTSIDDFIKEIKTYKKWNVLQVKALPGLLIKAMTKWGIFLINEANTLSPEIQLALANMVEEWVVVVGHKKYLVHPNFSLVFTSNQDYAWTNPYNMAVIRKAGGIVNFDYEPSLEWEIKIVKTIYQKLNQNRKFEKQIPESALKQIANFVRKFREKLRQYNQQAPLEEKFLSQDMNDAWHFLYIRFYEKLLKELLLSQVRLIDLKQVVYDLFSSYLQDKIVWFGPSDEYIEHINDFEKLKHLLNKWFSQDVFINLRNVEQSDKVFLPPEILAWLYRKLSPKELEEAKRLIDFSPIEKEKNIEKQRTEVWFTTRWVNPNLFVKVYENEIKSTGEKLKKIEKIEKIQAIYERLVESHREKIIWQIKFRQDEMYGEVLDVEINLQIITFKVKDEKEFDLSWIKTPQDVLEKVFWNDDLEIVFEDEIFPNIFSNPKSLEIRRYSKILDYGDKIVFLWFRGEIKDIRYIGEESWKYYIPQSKVNDLLLSVYKVLSGKEIEKLEKGHYLVINKNDEVEFLTVDKIQEKIANWEKLKVLKKIKDELLEQEIRQRFANLDKLNLHDGAEEKAETGLPSSIYGKAYPLQSMIENRQNDIAKNFEVISQSTQQLLQKLETYLKAWEDLLLIWPSGVGKSALAKELAKRLNLPYISFQITDDAQEKDFSANLEWNEWELEEVFSPFLDYWVNGGVVELKELNMTQVLTFLNNFLDKNWSIVVNGRIYRRNPDFHLIATMNPFDQRLYPGTKPLNLALQARLKVINLDYLEIDEEKQVLLEVAKLYGKEFVGEFDVFLEEILHLIVYPIRKKIEELRLFQSMWTDEILKILAEKNITIDMLIRWIKTSDSLENINEKLKTHLYLSEEKLQLLPRDIKQVFDIIFA